MFYNIFSMRAIQVGVAFFVLVVGGSLLYSWHIRRTTESYRARHDQLTRRLEKPSGTRTAEMVNVPTENEIPGLVDTPDETTDTPMSEETEALFNETEFADIAEAFLLNDMVPEEAPAEEVQVSPFGFGPYPEIPDDFPKPISWHWSEEKRQDFTGSLRDQELMDRVLIKLWNQGDTDWRGAKLDDQNGRVYPLYHNTIYVTRWIDVPVEGGKIMPFPAGGSSGGTDWKPDFIEFVQSGGKIPDHIQFIDRDAAGYNPYNFLNLR